MPKRSRKRYTVGEVLETVFVDKDSDNYNFDGGYDLECVPDSEDDSAC